MKLFAGLALLMLLIYVGNTHGIGTPQIPAIAKVIDPFAGFWQQAEANTNNRGSHQVASSRSGTVVIDQEGIPHLFAANTADAMYLQGYMHAKDRLFQMDVSTRSTGGRLAEILGPDFLESDRIKCRKGMRVAAQRTKEAWLKNQETADVIQAYCDGINAYISNLKPRDYPVEYKILGDRKSVV